MWNPLYRDIERERLLLDSERLRKFGGGDVNKGVDLEKVVTICMDEDRDADEMLSLIMDNCLTIGDCMDAIEYTASLGAITMASKMNEILSFRIEEVDIKHVR